MGMPATFLKHYNYLNSHYIFMFTIQIASFKGHFTWSIKNIIKYILMTSTDTWRNWFTHVIVFFLNKEEH